MSIGAVTAGALAAAAVGAMAAGFPAAVAAAVGGGVTLAGATMACAVVLPLAAAFIALGLLDAGGAWAPATAELGAVCVGVGVRVPASVEDALLSPQQPIKQPAISAGGQTK